MEKLRKIIALVGVLILLFTFFVGIKTMIDQVSFESLKILTTILIYVCLITSWSSMKQLLGVGKSKNKK